MINHEKIINSIISGVEDGQEYPICHKCLNYRKITSILDYGKSKCYRIMEKTWEPVPTICKKVPLEIMQYAIENKLKVLKVGSGPGNTNLGSLIFCQY